MTVAFSDNSNNLGAPAKTMDSSTSASPTWRASAQGIHRKIGTLLVIKNWKCDPASSPVGATTLSTIPFLATRTASSVKKRLALCPFSMAAFAN